MSKSQNSESVPKTIDVGFALCSAHEQSDLDPMAFQQTTPALEEIVGTLVEPLWNLTSNHPGPPCSPGGPSWNLTSNHPDHPTAWNPGGTLPEPCETSQTRSPCRTLVKPYLKPPHPALGMLAPPHSRGRTWQNHGGTLVEPLWKSWTPWWNPGGTLIKPALHHPARETLVKPWWNPAPHHPAALAEPGGTLVEPWWNLGGTLVEPSWNLTSGPPRTTPEPSFWSPFKTN